MADIENYTIDIVIPGVDRLDDEQKKIVEDAVSKSIADQYLEDIHETIMLQGPGLDERPWKPLSPMRIAQRGRDWPILIDTGALFSSFYVEQRETGSYKVATDNPYAELHEYGGMNEQDYYVPERSYLRSTLAKNESKYMKLAETVGSNLVHQMIGEDISDYYDTYFD